MAYKDRWATDDQGNRFVFTVEMQRQLEARGLPPEPEHVSELGAVLAPVPQEPRAEATTSPAPQAVAPAEGRSSAQEDDLQPESIQIDPVSGKYLGRLKWYNASRGYGFIARGGGEDIFFHKSDVLVDPEELPEGTWILYDVEETTKGLEASEVERYEGELGG
jgi:CspA family cold shock protein